MKKSIFIILLLFLNNGYSQTITDLEDINAVVNVIADNLTTNPENPLNVDQDFLNRFTTALPEGSLKTTIESFNTNLNKDDDQSYRQLYWDLSAAFDQNPSLGNQTKFSSIMTQLDVLLTNTELIDAQFKDNIQNYQLGIFMNDESFVTSLTQLTGSYEVAQVTSMGIDLIVGLFEEAEQNAKFKEDYLKVAKLSSTVVYAERDINLSKALIDAEVGIEQHQMITPIYRYDFSHDASLRVENGVLKYINPIKNITINLTLAEKRHDGGFYKRVIGAFGIGEQAYETAICIADNDSTFYLYTGANVFQDKKCDKCLPEKTGVLINAVTGKIIAERNNIPSEVGSVRDMEVKHDTVFVWFYNNEWTYYLMKWQFTSKDGKLKLANDKESYKEQVWYIDGKKTFNINGVTCPFIKDYGKSYQQSKNSYSFIKDDYSISLFWGEDYDPAYTGPTGEVKATPRHHSSMLQVGKNTVTKEKYFNPDAMTNELTGLAMNKKGDLFYTGKNGCIGVLLSADYKLNDENLSQKMRNSFSKKAFELYDYNKERKFLSNHGELSYTISSTFPSLSLTPDQKWLVYVVADNLYIINAQNINEVKGFKLTFEPNSCFFGKENGITTIYLQGQNGFKFPITKKYSLKSLVGSTLK